MANIGEQIAPIALKTISRLARQNVFLGKEICSCKTANISRMLVANSFINAGVQLDPSLEKCIADSFGVKFDNTSEQPYAPPIPENPIAVTRVYCFMVEPFVDFENLPPTLTGVTWRVYRWNGFIWELNISFFQDIGETEKTLVTLENGDPEVGVTYKYKIETAAGLYPKEFFVKIPNCLTEPEEQVIEFMSRSKSCSFFDRDSAVGTFTFNLAIASAEIHIQYYDTLTETWITFVTMLEVPAGNNSALNQPLPMGIGLWDIRVLDVAPDVISNVLVLNVTPCPE